MTTRTLIATLVSAVAISVLTGCGSTDSSDVGVTDLDPDTRGSDGTLSESSIELADGREITCVVYASYKQGGVSCDWVGATTAEPEPMETP